jgi:phospholipid-translocating ATPase
MAPQEDVESGPDPPNDPPNVGRTRWATRRLPGKTSHLKRLSLVGRKHGKSSPDEKSSARGSGSQGDVTTVLNDTGRKTDEQLGPGPRELYFNLPLPDRLKDEEGYPVQQYTRNKIRTAKYTPLSFVPKNLWFQFHNIANIFFLFLVILDVGICLLNFWL